MNNNINTKRTQRSPEEIIAETEARLASLLERKARKEAKNDPNVQSLLDHRNNLLKHIRECKKLLGNGPQSAEIRIQKHMDWIEAIQSEVAAATKDLESFQNQLSDLDKKIQAQILSTTGNYSQASN